MKQPKYELEKELDCFEKQKSLKMDFLFPEYMEPKKIDINMRRLQALPAVKKPN